MGDLGKTFVESVKQTVIWLSWIIHGKTGVAYRILDIGQVVFHVVTKGVAAVRARVAVGVKQIVRRLVIGIKHKRLIGDDVHSELFRVRASDNR